MTKPKITVMVGPADGAAPAPAAVPEGGLTPAAPLGGDGGVVGISSDASSTGAGVTNNIGPRRPMARATRITLFEREVRERLSRAALDLIFSRAEVLSEGQRTERGGRTLYFGSTMLTIDLPGLDHVLRDACDAGTARRLTALMEGDSEVATRIQDIARQEAVRVVRAPLTEVSVHVSIRAQGAKVFIDVDVEGTPEKATE